MKKYLITALLAVSVVFASTAIAGSTSTTFNATATVTAECAVEGGSLVFPTTGLIGMTKIPAQGSVTIECTGAIPVSIKTTGSDYSFLKDSNGQSKVSHSAQVFSDSARTKNFYTVPLSMTATGGVQQIPVYAHVYKNQAGHPELPAGLYTADFNFTITY